MLVRRMEVRRTDFGIPCLTLSFFFAPHKSTTTFFFSRSRPPPHPPVPACPFSLLVVASLIRIFGGASWLSLRAYFIYLFFTFDVSVLHFSLPAPHTRLSHRWTDGRAIHYLYAFREFSLRIYSRHALTRYYLLTNFFFLFARQTSCSNAKTRNKPSFTSTGCMG